MIVEPPTLADVMPSALSALGVDGEANRLELAPARSVVVLLIDGFGWNLLRGNEATAPFLAGFAGRPIVAGFPTTTAASITSLGTGLRSGMHGIVGYTSRLDGLAEPINWLAWAPSGAHKDVIEAFPPETIQPYPTALERAERAGVHAVNVSSGRFRGSGLTRAALRGGTFASVVTAADTVAAVAVAARGPQPSLVYCYNGDLDLVSHVRGWQSDAWQAQLALIDRQVELLAERLPAGSRLVVTGDHGMVDVPDEAKIDFDAEPELSEGVDALANDARCRYVYTREPAAVRQRWTRRLGDGFDVLTRDEAIGRGWFGPVRPEIAGRIGDLVVLATGPGAVVRRSAEPRLARLVGNHGALSDDELLVPLLLR